MSFRRVFIGIASVLALFTQSYSQSLFTVQETASFTEYIFQNDSLRLRPALSVTADLFGNDVRWEFTHSEYVPVVASEAAKRMIQPSQNNRTWFISDYGTYQRKPVANINIPVVIGNGNAYRVLKAARFKVYKNQAEPAIPRAKLSTATPLATGDWYKIPIQRGGIYQINRAYLQQLGIRVEEINPRNIQIWAGLGTELPKENATPRPEFRELPIVVEGETDGKFDTGDRILFYQQDVNRVFLNTVTNNWEHALHHAGTLNYVFLTVGNTPGRRLVQGERLPTGNMVTTFNDFIWREDERTKPEPDIKSGAKWLGQTLSVQNSGFTTVFTDTLSGFTSGNLQFEFVVASRVIVQSARFVFFINGVARDSTSVLAIEELNGVTGLAARESRRLFTTSVNATNGIITAGIQFRHPNTFSSVGFVDFIRVRGERPLQARRGFLNIYENRGTNTPVTYELQGFSQIPYVWEITNPQEPRWIPVDAQGNVHRFTAYQRPGVRFVAQTDFFQPQAGTKVNNQQLRGITAYPFLVVVTTTPLLSKAVEYARYREQQSGISTVVVTQEAIFNEFSNGVPDFVAIRDYMRFLYQRAPATSLMPKHLLLFGDATFDYKNIENSRLTNRVFTFQSLESLDRINSYGSDDFFGLLDANEGNWDSNPFTTSERVDIGIGRFPIQTTADADVIIDKIKRFESRASRGLWRTQFTFVSDDDVSGSKNDTDLHLINADVVAESIPSDATGIRVRKIHTLNYQAQTTAFGRRFPQATADLIQAINEGSLIVNYSGHGDERTLSDEKLFDIDYLNQLNNPDRLGIFVTATCSFGRFDDNSVQSGAEQTVLLPNAGMVASFTTTRTVFTSRTPGNDNFGLNLDLTEAMVSRDMNGRPRLLGDIYRLTKNRTPGASLNGRKFILLGDPSMTFGLPGNQAAITAINGNQLDGNLVMARALDEVVVSGQVGIEAPLSQFQGEVFLTVFDGVRRVNYPEKPWTANFCTFNPCAYNVQNDLLFRGRASVSNGMFSIRFIVPKDIQFSNASGRLHFYADGEAGDATGSFSSIRFNGISTERPNDGKGPDIRIFINDSTFVDGGLVNANPRLIVKLRDDTGINTAGSGVGHDMTVEVNTIPARLIGLNNTFVSGRDDFRTGTAEVTIPQLPEGTWTARVRAWDIFNNLSEETIRFTVSTQGIKVRNLYNYPNPMSSQTVFVFEHNLPFGQEINVQIRIFTQNGKPVSFLQERLTVSGNTGRILWNGRDADGKILANGTYLYHVRIETETLSGKQKQEQIEKLVILR